MVATNCLFALMHPSRLIGRKVVSIHPSILDTPAHAASHPSKPWSSLTQPPLSLTHPHTHSSNQSPKQAVVIIEGGLPPLSLTHPLMQPVTQASRGYVVRPAASILDTPTHPLMQPVTQASGGHHVVRPATSILDTPTHAASHPSKLCCEASHLYP